VPAIFVVMPGFVPGIYAFGADEPKADEPKAVDGRDKPGHDDDR
jgi:hypothetical protein